MIHSEWRIIKSKLIELVLSKTTNQRLNLATEISIPARVTEEAIDSTDTEKLITEQHIREWKVMTKYSPKIFSLRKGINKSFITALLVSCACSLLALCVSPLNKAIPLIIYWFGFLIIVIFRVPCEWINDVERTYLAPSIERRRVNEEEASRDIEGLQDFSLMWLSTVLSLCSWHSWLSPG